MNHFQKGFLQLLLYLKNFCRHRVQIISLTICDPKALFKIENFLCQVEHEMQKLNFWQIQDVIFLQMLHAFLVYFSVKRLIQVYLIPPKSLKLYFQMAIHLLFQIIFHLSSSSLLLRNLDFLDLISTFVPSL